MSPLRRVAHVTDLHIDDRLSWDSPTDARTRFLRVLGDVRERGIGEMVLGGDLGGRPAVRWLAGRLREEGLAVRAVPGNHDAPRLLGRLGLLPSPALVPAGPDGPAVAYLDTGRDVLGRRSLARLAGFLAEGTGPAVVFAHHPVLDCGGTAMDRLYPLRDREAAAAALEASGRDVAWVCGHYHNAYEVRSGRITQYVTPSSLLQLKARSDRIEPDGTAYGYRILEIGPDGLASETVLFDD